MKISKYTPFAVLFFFFNSVGLPFGLTFMALLGPLFYYWTIRRGKVWGLFTFILLLTPFFIAHMLVGVDVNVYLASLINFTLVFIFCHSCQVLVGSYKLDTLFHKLLKWNFILCLIAIPFYSSPYFNLFWIEQYLTEGIDHYRRLRLFTYEASYYATLFVPLCLFFFYKTILSGKVYAYLKYMPMVLLPLLLSFSLGVIGGLLIAVLVTLVVHLRTLLKKKAVFVFIVSSSLLMVLGVVFSVLFFPDNTLFLRLKNIFSGHDSSGNGRTFEAFLLAYRIAEQKSLLFGAGLGQIKVIGTDIIRSYYGYDENYVISIPNATAETFAIFGWLGLLLRFSIQGFLFFYKRVWSNYYRLSLFVFIFIYQFTGSFITNMAEYLIWILAFWGNFQQYDKNTLKEERSNEL
ncbi:hypothetical protein [Parasegetibacter sp. NRK P23]|uniref:hypothetical protein n=1 Tax=Parasegetibacter sp. NRK P23 TaxID=2942999 RepID=UPI002044B08A|nr:hypothetical protein [Parasegetibacter sp. NRK P23]MCM5527511.1 hypothetical protein [Parasegetibacter sp. NRK P23]